MAGLVDGSNSWKCDEALYLSLSVATAVPSHHHHGLCVQSMGAHTSSSGDVHVPLTTDLLPEDF